MVVATPVALTTAAYFEYVTRNATQGNNDYDDGHDYEMKSNERERTLP